jgi:hypothetical protein
MALAPKLEFEELVVGTGMARLLAYECTLNADGLRWQMRLDLY